MKSDEIKHNKKRYENTPNNMGKSKHWEKKLTKQTLLINGNNGWRLQALVDEFNAILSPLFH